jgi:hypothetical protein
MDIFVGNLGLDHGAGHPSSSCLSQKGITH